MPAVSKPTHIRTPQGDQGEVYREERRAANAMFVLNVWEEISESGYLEWRGELLDVDSDAIRPFIDWPEMVNLIADVLDNVAARATIEQRNAHTSDFLTHSEEKTHV